MSRSFWALVYFLKSLAVKFPVVKKMSILVAMSMKVVESKGHDVSSVVLKLIFLNSTLEK